MALATAESEVTLTLKFDPFGTQTLASSTDGEELNQNPYSFASGIRDRSTNFIRFGARYYDAFAATFTQQDTLDAPLDPLNGNRYAYASNDPINNLDPRGRDSISQRALDGCAKGAVIGASGGAITGGIAGAAVGGVGALPGAVAGAQTGFFGGCATGAFTAALN